MKKKDKEKLQQAMVALKHNLVMLMNIGAKEAAAVVSYKSVDIIESIIDSNTDSAIKDIYLSCYSIQNVIYLSLSESLKKSSKLYIMSKDKLSEDVVDAYKTIYNANIEVTIGTDFEKVFAK